MKHRIGKFFLENDVECKVIPNGYEIFSHAAREHNINPESIHTANGNPVRADWGMHGSIIVEPA